MARIRMVSIGEFSKLKKGDIVYVKVGEKMVHSRVLNGPIWNSDADEPNWEVETSNGWADAYSLYL